MCIQYLSTKSLGDNSGHSTRLYYFDTTTHPNKKIVVKNVVAEIKFCSSVVDKPIVFQFFAIRFALCPLPMNCCLNPLYSNVDILAIVSFCNGNAFGKLLGISHRFNQNGKKTKRERAELQSPSSKILVYCMLKHENQNENKTTKSIQQTTKWSIWRRPRIELGKFVRK